MTSQTFQFVMRDGPTPGKTYSISKSELFIGRDIKSDIVLNVSEVSRRHARVSLQEGGYILEDLGSTNGTFVNGQRLVGPHLLLPGEIVRLGDRVTLAFEAYEFDPDATIIATPPPAATAPQPAAEPPPQPIAQPQAVQPQAAPPQPAPPPQHVAPPPPAYADQVAPAAPQEARGGNKWLWAGIGCMAIIVIAIIAGAFVFDYLNLYCTPPFNVLFQCQ